MAICERRNDRPAALARSVSGGWRAERSCCLAKNAAAWRQGKKIANEPLRVKVGERSERIVARDPPTKGRYGVGGSNPTGEHRLKGSPTTPRSRPTTAKEAHAIEVQRFDPSPRSNGEGPIARADGVVMPPRRSGPKAFRRDGRSLDNPHAEDRDASSNSEAISASGALNRPRRNSGGMTASTASSFSEGSMRK